VPPATAALLAIALSALPFDALAARPNVTCAPDADPATLANEGKELGKAGKNIEAYEKLVCAYRISQSYTVSANLGLIELALGLHADAANHMSRAVRDWPLDDEKKKKAREVVEAKLGETKKRVLAITVRVSHQGARIGIDGEDFGLSPLPGPAYVEPGEHRVTAAIEGFATATTNARGVAGEHTTVELRIAAEPTAPAPGGPLSAPHPAKPQVDAGRGARPYHPAWVSVPLAASATGLGLGLFYRYRVGKIYDEELATDAAIWGRTGPGASCDPTPMDVDCGTLKQALAAQDYNATAGTVSLALASGALLVGGALLLVNARNDPAARRPFHPGWLALPAAVGTVALATAAGLHARTASLARSIEARSRDVLVRSGVGGCRDPANANDCATIDADKKAATKADSATVAMAIIGGAGIVATGSLAVVYFVRSRSGDGADTTRMPLHVAPIIGPDVRGIGLSSRW
jgi:hypothetical protein